MRNRTQHNLRCRCHLASWWSLLDFRRPVAHPQTCSRCRRQVHPPLGKCRPGPSMSAATKLKHSLPTPHLSTFLAQLMPTLAWCCLARMSLHISTGLRRLLHSRHRYSNQGSPPRRPRPSHSRTTPRRTLWMQPPRLPRSRRRCHAAHARGRPSRSSRMPLKAPSRRPCQMRSLRLPWGRGANKAELTSRPLLQSTMLSAAGPKRAATRFPLDLQRRHVSSLAGPLACHKRHVH
mmetsp:Transcript_3671/g.10628  ORF Transcript_3671/g.10628 Transcript_3671/m.10628 type:complete len:234 (-) Transcript_3671:2028-2729(-)